MAPSCPSFIFFYSFHCHSWALLNFSQIISRIFSNFVFLLSVAVCVWLSSWVWRSSNAVPKHFPSELSFPQRHKSNAQKREGVINHLLRPGARALSVFGLWEWERRESRTAVFAGFWNISQSIWLSQSMVANRENKLLDFGIFFAVSRFYFSVNL